MLYRLAFVQPSFLLFLSATLLTGCIAENLVEPTAVGSIAGYMFLRDDEGERQSRHDSIMVQLAPTGLKAFTDSSGKWEIPNVPAGIYDIRYSRPDYSPNVTRAFQFVGGGTAYITATVELNIDNRDTFIVRDVRFGPHMSISSRVDSITDTGFVLRYDTTIVPNQVLEVIGEMVFEDPKIASRMLYFQPGFQAGALNIQVGLVRQGRDTARIQISQLESQGYLRGRTYRITLTTRQLNTYYYEPSTRQRIYSDAHNAAVIEVTLPE